CVMPGLWRYDLDLDELERLLAAAPPGPYTVVPPDPDCDFDLEWAVEGGSGLVALTYNAADAALDAVLRNAAPTLVKHERERQRLLRIEAAAVELDRLYEAEFGGALDETDPLDRAWATLRAALRGDPG